MCFIVNVWQHIYIFLWWMWPNSSSNVLVGPGSWGDLLTKPSDIIVSGAGGSKKSKWTKSSMPNFFKVNTSTDLKVTSKSVLNWIYFVQFPNDLDQIFPSTTTPRLERKISGYVCSVSSVVKAFSAHDKSVLNCRICRCFAKLGQHIYLPSQCRDLGFKKEQL